MSRQDGRQVALVGTRGSGKTTILAAMDIACTDKANQQKNFRYMISEFSTSGQFLGVKTASSYLKRGKFPDATERGRAYEARALMKFKRTIGWKEVQVPFVETAGEDIGSLIQSFGKGVYAFNPSNIGNRDSQFLYTQVLNSEGFILVCPVTRAITQDGTLGQIMNRMF